MCDQCNNRDGVFHCEDCGSTICLKPSELRLPNWLPRFVKQAVLLDDGDYVCDSCANYVTCTIK